MPVSFQHSIMQQWEKCITLGNQWKNCYFNLKKFNNSRNDTKNNKFSGTLYNWWKANVQMYKWVTINTRCVSLLEADSRNLHNLLKSKAKVILHIGVRGFGQRNRSVKSWRLKLNCYVISVSQQRSKGKPEDMAVRNSFLSVNRFKQRSM